MFLSGEMIDALRHILGAAIDGDAEADLHTFSARVDPLMRAFGTDSAAAAIVAGFEASRVGFAFAGGYRAALARLVPALGPVPRACLCATEKGGAHPRAIATRLVDARESSDAGAADGAAFHVSGTKTFATLATEADEMLVVASTGEVDGRNALRLLRIPTTRTGVTIAPRPTTPFAPEIGHAVVTLDRVPVAVDEVLEGDGYTRYLKPFRTIEDIHVLSAVLGHVIRMARASEWQPATLESFLPPLAAAHALSIAPADAAETHLALGALFEDVRLRLAVVGDDEWSRCDAGVRARWERDRALLDVAEGARAQRLVAARAKIRSGAEARRSSPRE